MKIIVNGSSQSSDSVTRFLKSLERGGEISEPLRKVRRQIVDYVTNYKNRVMELNNVYSNLEDHSADSIKKLVFDLNGRRENEVLNELKRVQSAFLDIVGTDVRDFLKVDVIRDQAFYDWLDSDIDLSESLSLLIPRDVNGINVQLSEIKTKLGDLPSTVGASGSIPNKTRADLKCLRDCKYRWEEETQLLDSYLNTLHDVSVIFVIIGEMKKRIEKMKQQSSITEYEALNR